MTRLFLVKTDHGTVVVRVNPDATSGLASDLLSFEAPTAENTADISMEVPLRAFGAKMVDIIETVGTGDFSAGARMRDMMVREKATSELKRIERWARERKAP